MIWYFLALILSIVIVLLTWKALAKYYWKDEFLYSIEDRKKQFFSSILFAILLTSLLLVKPLYANFKCIVKGNIMKTDTQYSWVMGECQAKTINGSYIDINRNRGLPDNNENLTEE